jgi:hypothetical protein
MAWPLTTFSDLVLDENNTMIFCAPWANARSTCCAINRLLALTWQKLVVAPI